MTQAPIQDSRRAIELASLRQRHPIGDTLLDLFARQVILRLGMDPVRAAVGTHHRAVTVDRISHSAPGVAVSEVVEIAWSGFDAFTEEYLIRVSRTVNEQRITEDAAIGVMSLLIHDLEGVTIDGVLQIGSGGDYAITLSKGGPVAQVEVSGIRNDSSGREARVRLADKQQQLLRGCPRGYVSVTTFRCPGMETAHSYLHYVERRLARKKRKKGK